ncbi:hypothetical protein IJH02_02275 [Candidatus Saccharibacteria bacterium]|nr:hypothetical protein [Candidatus Saccharibacteria bacterium]
MFDLESKNPDEITINTKKTSVTFNVVENEIDAGLSVGKIKGPGEFEIGDVTIRGIDVDKAKAVAKKEAAGEDADATEADPTIKSSGKTIYDAEVGGIHIGIIGGCEDALDELGVSDILCTSSVRAVREIEPKVVISMGNIDGMVTELKISARTEKKFKVKNEASLPATLEVVSL